jgi:hypothetical protein
VTDFLRKVQRLLLSFQHISHFRLMAEFFLQFLCKQYLNIFVFTLILFTRIYALFKDISNLDDRPIESNCIQLINYEMGENVEKNGLGLFQGAIPIFF